MAPQMGNDAGAAPNSAGNSNTNQGGNTSPRGKRSKPFKRNPKKKSGKDKKKPVQLVIHAPNVMVEAFASKPNLRIHQYVNRLLL